MITRTLAELAEILDAELVGDPAVTIRGVAGIREALAGDVTFIANSRYESYLHETRASAVICAHTSPSAPLPLLKVGNPYLAFQRIVRLFRPDLHRPEPGVHPTAVVAPDAVIGDGVSIGAHCVIEAGASIGRGTVLMPRCYLGEAASVGEDSYLYPGVVIREECHIGDRCIIHPNAVIGADGFGFAFDAGRYHKIPQVGNVIVGNDVEIGANTAIDRATTDSTRIGDGTKIDNLAQIGHNVNVGRHCIIVAQVGISGSTELEDYVTIGGQAGLAGHIRIGTGAQIGAQSGVSKSVAAGETVFGTTAIPIARFKRLNGYIQRLPQIWEALKKLESRMQRAEQEAGNPQEKERVP